MYIESEVAIPLAATAAAAITKGIEYLISFARKKLGTDTEEINQKLITEIKVKVGELDQIIQQRDNEGVPLIYTPRRLMSQQAEYNELLRNLTHQSEMISKTLDRLALTLESMVRVLDKVEERSVRH